MNNGNFIEPSNSHFSKGVSPWFFPKIEIFACFFFQAEFIEKRHSVKFEKENEEFLDYKKIDLKRLQGLHFSKGVSPWFLSKIDIFLPFAFMQNASRKIYWWSSRKKMKTFLTLKTSIYKSPKICIFPKRLIHGFCPKLDIFPTLVFVQYGSLKLIDEVLERKWSHFRVEKYRFKRARKFAFFQRG